MEMEFFVPPADAEEWYRYWVDERFAWHLRYGIRESNLRVRPHDADELSHYSSGTSDIEYLFPIGWSELEGIANRGDFDLTAHTNASGTKLEWVGAGREPLHPARDRAGTRRQPLDAGIPRRRLRRGGRRRPGSHRAAPPSSAGAGEGRRPAADRQERGHGGKARKLYEQLRQVISVEYDDGGQIGRRYRRQDEIGTPYALTIDDQTLEDDTITIRERDSLAQERIPIGGARERLLDRLAEPWHPSA